MLIGCCTKCRYLDLFSGSNVCNRCGELFISLEIDSKKWNQMNADETDNYIDRYLLSIENKADDVNTAEEYCSFFKSDILNHFDYIYCYLNGWNPKTIEDGSNSGVKVKIIELMYKGNSSVLVEELENRIWPRISMPKIKVIINQLIEEGVIEHRTIDGIIKYVLTDKTSKKIDYLQAIGYVDENSLTKGMICKDKDYTKSIELKENELKEYFLHIISVESSIYSLKRRFNQLVHRRNNLICREINENKDSRKDISLFRYKIEYELDYLYHIFCKEMEVLSKLYGLGFVYEKYRNFVCISSFYDYFSSGRCDKLEGIDGAYNLYEQDSKMNAVISKIDDIQKSLEQIKKNQYSIYNEIKKANEYLVNINDELMVNNMLKVVEIAQLMEMIDGLGEIENNTREIAYNSKVTAFYSKQTNDLVNAMGYLVAFQ